MSRSNGRDPEQDPARKSAVRRLAEDPVSRRKFVAATGTGSALALFIAACGGDSDTTGTSAMSTTTSGSSGGDMTGTEQFGEGDLGIVNYALTLEYLEAAFYADVAKSGLFKGDQLALLKTFGENEQAHVKALEQTANKLGKAAPKPETKFPLDSADSVAKLAATVENLGAAAYLGQAANIESDEVLAAALSIHTVEARHAAVLNQLVGDPITPDGAFAKPASAEEVLPKVQGFIVS
jgi:hypothetical protein